LIIIAATPAACSINKPAIANPLFFPANSDNALPNPPYKFTICNCKSFLAWNSDWSIFFRFALCSNSIASFCFALSFAFANLSA
jgi:hypothetical protein